MIFEEDCASAELVAEVLPAKTPVYLTGVFANLLHGIATTVFLWMFGLPLIRKLQRIRQKYDLKA